jgi:uncharacterized repeat protein (TIGR01451 family)
VNGPSPSPRRVGHHLRVFLQLVAVLAVTLPVVDGPVGVGVERALADPAANAANVSRSTAGALPAGTVPDGTCAAKITTVGGGGASSPVSSGLGGLGGAGASVTATFSVVPGQSYSGTVGAGGATPGTTSAAGGAGAANGGNGGTVGVTHPGGGGGGSTNVIIGGTTLVTAGGGGGGGGAHSVSPAGNGGGGGFTGIAAGTTAVGTAGSAGVDTGNTVSGGGGGQSATGGSAGTNSGQAARNGSAGLVAGGGGNGGSDGTADSGGGGGAGYTGGGGGAATVNDGGTTSGSGGGGGSSRVAATSPVSGAPAPTGVSGAAGSASPTVSGPGATGSITIDWIPCLYDLGLTKTVSSPSVNAGNSVTWTVTVTNNGPSVMTKGDTVTLTDSLPAGPNGTPAPANKVTSFAVTPGSSSGGLSSAGAITCTGLAVGSSMPASTTCSRAYSAPAAGGAPSGGTRGLDVGEKITITYQQIISNTAPCATITNTATVKDRPTQSGTTDIVGNTVTDTVNQNLTINCYDLAITKSAGAPDVTRGGTITWTIAVTNNGPADMAGPVDTTANPLKVTDTFPGGSLVNGPVTSTQTGPAGPCTLGGSLITCTNGLASGATETLLFTQTVKAGAAIGSVVSNTASVTDFKPGDSNDSATGTTTVKSAPTLNLHKTVSSRASAADQFTVAITNGATTVDAATTSGAGTTAATGSNTLTAGTTYTLSDAMAAGSASSIGQYTKSISCTNSTGGSATVLPSGSGASFTITPANGDAIDCTFTNGATPPTLQLSKAITSRFAASDQFTLSVKHAATTDASATTSGAGTSASTATTAVTAGTTYTVGESMAGGTSTLADYVSSIACTNATGGTGTTLPSGSGQSFSITPAAGDAISCTLTNAAKPHVTLNKTVAGRVAAGDQFTVAITHGPTTDASVSTSGAGTSATTGSQGLVAGTTYTLADTLAVGSPSSLSDYLSSIACTNANGSSSTTLPTGSGTSFTLTPAAADNITCTFINTAKPHLTLVKSVASRANAADQFTVAVKNGPSTIAAATTSGAGTSATTGSQVLTGGTTYTLTDVMAAGSPSVIGQYASGIACTNSNAGSSTTLPSGSGTSFTLTPANGDIIACTITNTAGTASLGLTKTASPNTNAAVGTVITYTYGVTNTGSLPLTNVTVSDPHAGLSAIVCAPAQGSTLAAAATMSCSATYTVTQADVDAGSILNTGTVSAKDPSNTTVTKTAGATVATAQAASLSLTKSALPSSGVVAGDVVTYSFQGRNTGTVTLHAVTVTDPMPGLSAIGCAPSTPATLAPNATIDCTATYTVTQADVDAGSFSNTATIAGLDPSNNPVSGSGGTTVNTLRVGALTLTKDAAPSTGVVAGDVVAYSLHGRNTGTVTLHNVTVTDPMPGLSAIGCAPSTPATLAPNATIDCTATYTVTQADVDAGSIGNTATIAGLDPIDVPVQATGSKTVTAQQVSAVALTKSASPNSNVNVGDTVTYTFGVTNTGTVTLHNAAVTDPMPGLSAIGCAPPAPATLAPNATMSCTATYTVTQADVDAGSIANTATVSALDPADAPVSNSAGTTVTANQVPDLTATKTASPNTGVVAGDVVTYTITGHNAGTVTLSNVTATDPMTGLSPIGCAPAAPASLAPGDDIVCTATYTVTQADVDAGSIANTATVHGSFGATTLDVPAGATVLADQHPELTVAKSASPNSGVSVGDTVTYTVDVQNTGTVTVDGVAVTDPMPGLSSFSCAPGAPAALAPNASMACTATYTVTQADVDAGSFSNTATASGTDPNEQPVSGSGSTTVSAQQSAALTLTKTPTPSTGVVAGDVVTYDFHGTNSGDVTLHGVDVTDPMPGLSAMSCSPAPPATLAPGDPIDCSATYTVTQADVDAGSFSNTASISGLDPANAPVGTTASATVNTGQTAGLGLTKSATPSSGVVAGDVVTYSFHGTNTGDVTLHNVDLTDPMSGLSAPSCTPTTPATLAPGATIDCTATYTVTQADVAAGTITNTATLGGLDPTDTAVTATDSVTVTTGSAGTPDASLHKKLEGVAGTTATWTITVTSSGTAALPGPFTVTDSLPDGLTYQSAGGDGWTCTGTRTISCTHAAALATGASSTITVATTITGTGKITNVASLDVLGESVTSNASVTPTTPARGFAFTGAEIARYGFVGLLLVLGGWFLLVAARRRTRDTATES